MSLRRSSPIRLDVRPHGVVLAGPLAKALVLAGAGAVLLAIGWPVSPLGALGIAAAAVVALGAVWRWERTRVVVTSDELRVVTGTLRRRSASVALSRLGAVEVEQGVLGRLLGYGTLVAGDLEVPHVARPRAVARLLRKPRAASRVPKGLGLTPAVSAGNAEPCRNGGSSSTPLCERPWRMDVAKKAWV